MHKVAKQHGRLILRMGVAAVLAWMGPRLGAAQTTQGGYETFSGVTESLRYRADALLASRAVEEKAVTGTREEAGTRPGQSDLNPTNPRRALGLKGSTATAQLDNWQASVAPILEKEGVPAELAAVVLVESGGNPAALSPKGGRGLWQLMPETARRYGLMVDSANDERVNVEKSTRVAGRYLRDLYVRFGSWPLALAAYNTGEQNLQRAIDKSGSNEFSVLSALGLLPLETRKYVPAVLTATQFTGGPFVLEGRRSSTTRIVFALNGN
jgi:hypothetical protein